MAVQIIPQQTIKTCDRCKVVLSNTNHKAEGSLLVKRHALDMQGSACADASFKVDLCDACLGTVVTAINKAVG